MIEEESIRLGEKKPWRDLQTLNTYQADGGLLFIYFFFLFSFCICLALHFISFLLLLLYVIVRFCRLPAFAANSS